ncbi:hypothetical protein DUI70_3205 [Streptomyces albus]|nr:hypothetical protein DUI70_3205 [Streptomyces albus]
MRRLIGGGRLTPSGTRRAAGSSPGRNSRPAHAGCTVRRGATASSTRDRHTGTGTGTGTDVTLGEVSAQVGIQAGPYRGVSLVSAGRLRNWNRRQGFRRLPCASRPACSSKARRLEGSKDRGHVVEWPNNRVAERP